MVFNLETEVRCLSADLRFNLVNLLEALPSDPMTIINFANQEYTYDPDSFKQKILSVEVLSRDIAFKHRNDFSDLTNRCDYQTCDECLGERLSNQDLNASPTTGGGLVNSLRTVLESLDMLLDSALARKESLVDESVFIEVFYGFSEFFEFYRVFGDAIDGNKRYLEFIDKCKKISKNGLFPDSVNDAIISCCGAILKKNPDYNLALRVLNLAVENASLNDDKCIEDDLQNIAFAVNVADDCIDRLFIGGQEVNATQMFDYNLSLGKSYWLMSRYLTGLDADVLDLYGGPSRVVSNLIMAISSYEDARKNCPIELKFEFNDIGLSKFDSLELELIDTYLELMDALKENDLQNRESYSRRLDDLTSEFVEHSSGPWPFEMRGKYLRQKVFDETNPSIRRELRAEALDNFEEALNRYHGFENVEDNVSHIQSLIDELERQY